ncbi:MAG TPA: PAS domain S-box protein [Oscillatoriaceae cyanobacterium M33_DOE_052]|nr:PAS domain S-box protein [Oscillatoriaceae cyanobacterium M33_DOE_052]
MADAVGDALMWWGEDGSLLYANRAACQMLGVVPSCLFRVGGLDLPVTQVWDVELDLDEESWRARWRQIQQPQRFEAPNQSYNPVTYQTTYRCHNGKPLAVAITAQLWHWQGSDWVCTAARLRIPDQSDAHIGAKSESPLYGANDYDDDCELALCCSPAFIFHQDLNLYYRWSLNSICGLTATDVAWKSEWEIFAPEDAERLAAIKRRVLATGAAVKQETFVEINGQICYWDLTVHPKRNVCGEIVGIVGTAVDVTEMRTRSSQLEAMFMGTLDGIVILDDEGICLDANPAACGMFGLELGALRGRHLKELWFSEAAEPMWQCFLQGDETLRECVLCRPDGTQRIVEYAATAYFLPGKHLGVMRDVTEKILALQALRHSSARYRAIVEDQTELVCRFKPDGTLTFVNDAYCRYFQTQAEAEIGNSFLTIVAPGEVERVLEHLAELTVESPVGKIEHEVILPSSEVRIQQWIDRALFDEAGNVVEFQSVGRDVTDRVQAERALRERDELLAAIAANIPGVIFRWSVQKDGAISLLYISDGLTELMGIEPAAAFANPDLVLQAIHPEDRNLFLAHLRTTQENLEPVPIEYRILSPSCEWKWVRHTTRFSRYMGGERVIADGVLLDIHSRKQAELELYRHKQEFRTLVENSPDIIARFDTQMRHLYISPAIESATGIAPGAFLGKTNQELGMSPHLSSYWGRAIEKVFQTGNPEVIEFDFANPTGNPTDIHRYQSRLVAEFAPNGQVESVLSVTRDITDIKRAEEALVEERNFISAILETVGALVLVLDSSGQILRANPATGAILGQGEAELQNSYFWDFLSSDEGLASVKAACAQVAATGETANLETYWRAQTGNRILISWSLTALGNDANAMDIHSRGGHLKYIIAAGMDISDRERTAQIQASLERERELGELQRRFFSMVSHEFRTPLSTILMSAQILQNSNPQWLNAKTLKNLERIEISVKRSLHLMEDILTINQAETRRLEFHPQSINLTPFCRQIVEEMQIFLPDKKHNIRLNIDYNYLANPEFTSPETLGEKSQGLPPEHQSSEDSSPNPVEPEKDTSHDVSVFLDEKLLRSIFTNLLSNAIKYSPGGGTISCSVVVESERVIIRVGDEGMGISPEEQQRLFEAFYRGENVIDIPGSGLGLTVVKKCVDLQGGTVEVKSELGKGTEFCVTLPRR